VIIVSSFETPGRDAQLPSRISSIWNGEPGKASIAGSSAKLTTLARAVGSHSITALYSGDAEFIAGTSAVLDEEVAYPGAPDFVVSVTGSGIITAGQDLKAGGSIQRINGYTATVTLSCTNGLGSTMGCQFAPASAVAGRQSSLTITTVVLHCVLEVDLCC
jgi:hypothetical protein